MPLDPGRDQRPEAQQEDRRDDGDDHEPAAAAEEVVEEEALAEGEGHPARLESQWPGPALQSWDLPMPGPPLQ